MAASCQYNTHPAMHSLAVRVRVVFVAKQARFLLLSSCELDM
jgi:hypothetical protein